MKFIFYALLTISAISLAATIVSIVIAMRKKDSKEEDRVFKISKILFDIFYTTGGIIIFAVIIIAIMSFIIPSEFQSTL